MTARYRAEDLAACAQALFARAGLDAGHARAVADVLVEADMLGFATHGLQFVPAYVADIEAGRTRTSGAPEVLKDGGATLLLDGGGLSGQPVMLEALETGLARLKTHASVTVAVRGTRNISCLAVYARRGALAGALTLVAASAPRNAAVAPFGGREPLVSTNPIAAGIPADGGPVLFDTSTAAVANRRIERARREGASLPGRWLVDNEGRATDDPEAVYTDPPGAILPMGGLDQGYKGFALSLLVEALTSGLAGRGRSDPDPAAGNQVFLHLIDPGGFAGAEAFARETGWLAARARASAPMDPAHPVRVPGDRAQALFAEQAARGIALHPEILPRMRPLLDRYGVPEPAPLTQD